jgi:hypothetical protein
VLTVVPGQDRDLRGLGRFDQARRVDHRFPDRLFHQHRYAGGHAGQTALDVQSVGCGEDDAVGAVGREECFERRVRGDAGRGGHVTGRRCGIDDRGEFGAGTAAHLRDVPAADQTGPGDRDAYGRDDGHVS